MLTKKDLYPIGIGTFHLDTVDLDHEFNGFMYSYKRGQNLLSTNLTYYGGDTIHESVKRFVKAVDRDTVFYVCGVDVGMGALKDLPVKEQLNVQVDKYLAELGLETIDCIQLHDYTHASLPEIYSCLDECVKSGKVRFLGASNLGVRQINEICAVTAVDFFEGLYNFECRQNESEGVFGLCNEKDIFITCYQALRRQLTAKRNYPVLVSLAEKYGKAQNQVIINWIVRRHHLNPLIMCTEDSWTESNLASLEFTMEESDLDLLDAFSAPELEGVKVDWEHTGDGTLINRVPYLLGDYPTAPRKIDV